MSRSRVPGNIRKRGLGRDHAVLDDWVRINVADGTWTKNAPDTTGSSITNTAGINSVNLDDENNAAFYNGCVFYKELRLANGAPFDFTDKPVDLRGYVHLPGTGWRDDGSQVGGGDKPPIASKCYCVMGFTTDPENFPADAASSAHPKDIFGIGIMWTTTNNKTKYVIVRNTSQSGTYGSITSSSGWLDTITSGDVTDGRKCANRLGFQTEIVKNEYLDAGAMNPDDPPRSKYMNWDYRWDNGERRDAYTYSLDQRWGRTRTSKLYVWVAVGRNASTGDPITMEFDCYYHARMLHGGTNPSGKTGLSGP